MTVDESIASMKASLLKKSNVLPMFTAWTAAAATVAKSKFSPRFRRCLMQNASALKSFLHRVMRIFYCLPARSPVQCDPLRCVRGSPRRTRKFVSPTVPAVTVADLPRSYCVWAVRIKLSLWMFISPLPANACRHAVRLCNGARPAGAENSRPWAG